MAITRAVFLAWLAPAHMAKEEQSEVSKKWRKLFLNMLLGHRFAASVCYIVLHCGDLQTCHFIIRFSSRFHKLSNRNGQRVDWSASFHPSTVAQDRCLIWLFWDVSWNSQLLHDVHLRYLFGAQWFSHISLALRDNTHSIFKLLHHSYYSPTTSKTMPS